MIGKPMSSFFFIFLTPLEHLFDPIFFGSVHVSVYVDWVRKLRRLDFRNQISNFESCVSGSLRLRLPWLRNIVVAGPLGPTTTR